MRPQNFGGYSTSMQQLSQQINDFMRSEQMKNQTTKWPNLTAALAAAAALPAAVMWTPCSLGAGISSSIGVGATGAASGSETSSFAAWL